MRDATDNPQRPLSIFSLSRRAARAVPAGPIFETPLLELAFNRIRDFVRNRSATTGAEAAVVSSPLGEILSTPPAVPAPPSHPQEHASHD